MKFTKEDIPENSGLAVWHFAHLAAAGDGKITQEERLGLINTMKLTHALSAVTAASAGEDPEATGRSFTEDSLELSEMWAEGPVVDDNFIDHAINLITESPWKEYAVAVAIFTAAQDGLDDGETSMMGMAMERWEADMDEVNMWLEKITKVATTGTV